MLRQLGGELLEIEGFLDGDVGEILEGEGIKNNNPSEVALGAAIDGSYGYGGMGYGGFGGTGFMTPSVSFQPMGYGMNQTVGRSEIQTGEMDVALGAMTGDPFLIAEGQMLEMDGARRMMNPYGTSFGTTIYPTMMTSSVMAPVQMVAPQPVVATQPVPVARPTYQVQQQASYPQQTYYQGQPMQRAQPPRPSTTGFFAPTQQPVSSYPQQSYTQPYPQQQYKY